MTGMYSKKKPKTIRFGLLRSGRDSNPSRLHFENLIFQNADEMTGMYAIYNPTLHLP